jgi:hypothetical protein
MNRRQFAGLSFAAMAAEPCFVKGICSAVFPAGTSHSDCFRLASNAGFDAIGDPHGSSSTVAQRRRLRDEATRLRIEIASLWVLTPRSPSLSPVPTM